MDIKRILTTLDSLNEGTMQSATKKPTGPKFVGKWKGTDPASAAKNKLVGASESMLKDLERKLDETPVRDIMAEFKEFKQQVNEFAPDEGGGSRKFIPWPEFIEQLKQILHKDFDCKENIVKSTIKARFVPHDPMEFGPTMLYSYYETRGMGRDKGAVSTRGSIQVGKYTKGGLFGQAPDQLLTGFHLLKGHPFERHFDLTFDNIYKIANIIQGNTQGALEFKPEQQVNEFAPGDDNSGEEDGLHKYARMWFNGDDATQQQVEKILDGMGWEIGQDEGYDDEPGVFVVRAGDVNGDSYTNWAPEDLRETLDEVAMNPKAFAQAIATGQEKGVLVGFEFETCIPKPTVERWKTGGQTPDIPQYNAEDTSWADDKTAGDIITGIKRAGKGFQQTFEHLFKYKNSVKDQVNFKNPWNHYRDWAGKKADQYMEGQNRVTATFAALNEMLKDPEVAAMEIRYGSQAEEKYGPPSRWNGRTFTIALLKDQTGVDFSKRVPKAQLTPELADKVVEAMRWAYRATFGPYDTRTNAVSNAVDEIRSRFLGTYIPGYSSYVETTPESVVESAQHFSEFCQETMGTDNLKELLKKKWAFKGRVNNTSDTLKEQLWYFVTPNAPLPSSMASRSYRNEYKEGAEFLKANLTDVYGDNITIFTGYHQAAKQLDRWYIEPDGSLRPNGGDYSAEVVSPPLPAAEAMSALKTWYQKAKALNLYTNNSTGLHINVSIPGNLDVLKLAVFAGDQYVLKQFGRENNSYARSVIRNLQGQSTSLPELGSTEFKDAEKEMQTLVKRISGDHFATVNFNGKYVSFRHAGGDYLNKMTDIVDTVGRFVRAMVIAADPAAYRQEYVGKLVKFMKAPDVADEKLGLTDIRQYAEKGISVLNLDVVIAPTPDGNGFDVPTALNSVTRDATDYVNGRGLVIVEPDASARERMLNSSGFATATKEWMQTAPDSMFYRVVVYPNNRKSLTRFESDYADYGNNRGSAISSKHNGQKAAVVIKYRSLIKANDPHFAEAVKALRGGTVKPVPLPGSKAAPAPQAATFSSQQPENTGDWGLWANVPHRFARLSNEPDAPVRRFRTQQQGEQWLASHRGLSPERFEIMEIPPDYEQNSAEWAAAGGVRSPEPETETPRGDSNAQSTWTLNNGSIVRHYDPSQVNSERAYALAREMFQTYGRIVTISRDGVEYGRWPREERQEAQPGQQFYRFMNPLNSHTVHSSYYGNDQEAEAYAQQLANRVNGEISLLGVTPIGPDRRLGTFQPQVSESRIIDPKSKVNVIYNPQNSMKRIILAKAVDHALANRVINTYVHKSQTDPRRVPVKAQDFVLQPVKYDYTTESQQFNSKQEVIDHFVKKGKSAAAGAAAWERGWRGATPKAKPTKAPQAGQKFWWQDKDEQLDEYDTAGTAPTGTPTLGADLTKPGTPQQQQQQDPAQKAAQQKLDQQEKAEQNNLQKGVASMKMAGAAISNPANLTKAFGKVDDQLPLNPADKGAIASAGTVLAPIMSNPQLQNKFKDLVTQASASAKQQQKQQQTATPPGAKQVTPTTGVPK